MIIDQHLDRKISEKLLADNKRKTVKHTPSGKLSASMLGQPTQWQVLKNIGVKPKPFDEYTLRKFERGNHVEDWLVSQMPGVMDKQKYCEYRGVIGYCDTVINTSEGYDFKNGCIPNEVKSITNAAYRWLSRDRAIKYPHALQGALYALAEGASHFAVTYVASDDYRVMMLIEKTAKYKKDIDKIVDTYNKCIEDKKVPTFEAVEKWQSQKQYNSYFEWMKLSSTEIETKIKTLKIKWPKHDHKDK